jgi:UDP-N-acetylmuramyl pentapeptide phosphotransferase/UDP-N-acetylglucosamine-1-phosphate transferase
MKNGIKPSMLSNVTCSSITYQSLYLANLLVIPVVSFLLLIWLFIRLQNNTNQYKRKTRIHAIRAIQISLLGGVLLIIVPLLVVLLASDINVSLMTMLIYFITLHTGFVLIGMLNLSRAMSNKLPLF